MGFIISMIIFSEPLNFNFLYFGLFLSCSLDLGRAAG